MELVDISRPPAAANAVIRLHPSDNVAIARVPLPAGQAVEGNGVSFHTRTAIPAGHKVAIRAIASGEQALRYGQPIGAATQNIAVGDHVHTHNLAFSGRSLAYEPALEAPPMPGTARDVPRFLGYRREDGRVGTRNYIAVVAASNCAAHAAELIAASFLGEPMPPEVDGVVAFPHGEGCGMAIGPDTDQLRRTLGGVLDHPNVSGAIILGLGCEVNQIDHYLGADRRVRTASPD